MNNLDFDKINDFREVVKQLEFIKDCDAMRFDKLKEALKFTDCDEFKLSNAIDVMNTVYYLTGMAYASLENLEVLHCDKDFEVIGKVFRLLSIILKKDVKMI